MVARLAIVLVRQSKMRSTMHDATTYGGETLRQIVFTTIAQKGDHALVTAEIVLELSPTEEILFGAELAKLGFQKLVREQLIKETKTDAPFVFDHF